MSDPFYELEQRIAAGKKALEEQERLLASLKLSMGVGISRSSVNALIHEPTTEKFDELFNDENLNKKRTLTDDVKDVIDKFGRKEFTVAIVESALAKTGVVIDAKQPRARIAVAIGKLVENGDVVISYKGLGNTPNRYKQNDSNHETTV